MTDFWYFARFMLVDRTRLVLAFVAALLAAGGLGVGLLGMVPILQIILARGRDSARDLPQLAADFNVKWFSLFPQGFIDALPTGPKAAVFWVIVALGVLTLLGSAANFLHQYLSLSVIGRTIARIREQAFEHLVHLPLTSVQREGPTVQVRRVVVDSSILASGFNTLLGKALAQVSKGAVAAIAAIISDWKVALVAITVAPILYTIVRRTGKIIRRGTRASLNSMGDVMRTAQDAADHLRVVKAFTAEDLESRKFTISSQSMLKADLRVRTAKAVSSPLVETLVLFATGTLALIAASAIIDNHLDPANFLVTLAALGIAGAALKPMTAFTAELQTSGAAAQQLRRLIALPRETVGDATAPLARHAVSIEFAHASMTYAGATVPAVRDVSLKIRHGESIAFVGPNGCGKTSLLALLPRFYELDAAEPRGVISIDGTDITTVARQSLRAQIGVVTQETVLFLGTIEDNIRYGNAAATSEDVRRVAAAARAHEFITAKPGGYGELIGENGAGLSGGQRQRLAIARAMLRDPSILILDEATSMIDADSEAKINAAIAEFSKGRTILVVAHRLSTVLAADRIVVMSAGAIVDTGAHAELYERCDTYRKIAETQLLRGDEGTR